MKQVVEGALKGITPSSLHNQAKHEGLTGPIDQSAKHKYDQQSAQVNKKITEAEQNLSNRGQNMQDKTDQTMDRSVLGAAAFNALEGIPGVGHITKAISGSNFEKPTQHNTTPSKSGSPPEDDQGWKWKRFEGSSGSDNTFPGTQGNTVIIQKDNVSPAPQNSMSSHNLNVSNNISHQITNQSQTTLTPKSTGIHPKIKSGGEPAISENKRVDLNSSDPRSSPSSIKQSNVVKGRK